MKKLLVILFTLSIFISSCARNNVIKTHGISYLEKREKLITINQSNKNDTIKIFGQPATTGLTDNNLWIYIERTKTRGKLLKLGRNYHFLLHLLVFYSNLSFYYVTVVFLPHNLNLELDIL